MQKKTSQWRRYSIYFLLGLVVFGNLANSILFYDYFRRVTIDHWVGPNTSINRDTHAEYARMKTLLSSCGVMTKQSRFIVDDRTYPLLQAYPQPVLLTWLEIGFIFKNRNVPESQLHAKFWEMIVDFMRKNDMSAVVTSCSSLAYLPKNLLIQESGKYNESESFCCVRVPES